jgi:hypothetical protein
VGEHPRFLHGSVELFSLSASFAYATEDADPTLVANHVVNDFGEKDGFSDSSAAK